jgi:hypothetical protein
MWLGLGLFPLTAVGADGRAGEQIYRQRCAKCHGTSAEGTEDNYPNRLVGNKSVAQLASFIAKKMPKDSKQKCDAEEAQQVATYIFEAFYSKADQERTKPPRIELARLTVRQYRNAVADLIGSFTNSKSEIQNSKSEIPLTRSPLSPRGRGAGGEGGASTSLRGLHAAYFKSFGFRPDNRVFDRVDREIRFDFGETSPDPKKVDPERFSIRWEGAVLAPETGNYDFIVRTEHATRLWVNDLKAPLIDAWVRSVASGDSEHRASIFLLGGRDYPIRLEFAKGKQGEKDGKKDTSKSPPIKASIALEWNLPNQAAEVIPARNLSPNRVPEFLVVTTPFPPDDRSVGYERGTSISRAWDQATTDAAIEVASYVVAHLQELARVRDSAADREPRLREFCQRFAERAIRRPLTDEQKQFYIAKRFEGAPDLETAVKRVVLLVLKSPQFLYREVGGIPLTPSPLSPRGRGAGGEEGDGYDVASRLGFGLWDSLPDPELLAAAAAGRLTTPEQVAAQAERMVRDPRTRPKVRDFLFQWLKVDPAPDLSKAKEQFPGFDKEMATDLRTSLDLFLENVVWSEASDYRQLFLADYLYLNGRLARFYGVEEVAQPPDAAFQKVVMPARTCAGILSHPYLMATFAYTGTTSPIHRGVFLSRNVLGVPLRPPPEAFTPLPAELHPELTTRERVALQTRPQQCQSCHSVINPLGFTLENFDAVGRYRDQEKGKPIDASGSFETRTGQQVKFSTFRDLATFLAGSEDAQDAFIERLFHCLVKQPIRAFGPRALGNLRQFFAKHDYNIRKLIVEMMVLEEKGLGDHDTK